MSSLKDFEHYKALIITMDDLIFNLNELRYDFSLLLYPKTFNQFTYQDYTRRLGTIESMYSFIQPQMIVGINNKIENFIYDGKNLHNVQLKESADALLSFAKSKRLKVIVLTTHDALSAKQLLAYRHLDHDIDQVISISELCKDVPSIKLFHALSNLYHITLEELLVVTSMANIFKCVQYSPIDTIFVPDNKNSYFDISLYPKATMNTLFDVLQFALFGKYTSSDLYRDFLGYDENMGESQKRNRYNYLKMKYENHPDILPIVDEVFSMSNSIQVGEMTQEFHQAFNEIEKQFEQMDFKTEQEKSATLLSFEKIREREKEEVIEAPLQNVEEELPVEVIEEVEPIIDEIEDVVIPPVEEPVVEEVPLEVEEEPVKEEKLIFDQTQEFSLEQLDKTMEISPLEKTIVIPNNEKIGTIFDEIEEHQARTQEEEIEPYNEEEEKLSVLDIFLTGLLNLLTAIMVVSIGGLIYMCFNSMVADNALFNAFFNIIFVGFSDVCVAIYEFIVQPFPAISIQHVTAISPLFLKYLILVGTVFLVLCIYKIITYFWHRREYYGEL